jgi:hypothetical protein
MMIMISWILRFGVVALLLLPLVVPTVSTEDQSLAKRAVTVVSNRETSIRSRNDIIQKIRGHFGASSQITFQNLSSPTSHPLQVFDAVGQAVRASKSITVLDLDASLWGESAGKFREQLDQTPAAQTERLFVVDSHPSPAEERLFLFVADLYVPKVSFLGEETLAVVEIAGRLDPSQTASIEILVRSNGDLITTERKTVTAASDGTVQAIVDVPVSFIKAQSQVITVDVKTPFALASYAQASTTVFVAHNKTTVLHVAVSPDWSLRAMRQKLKFWPNLDLLSYYILRERWDDNSIPQSQLSLIEFPSDKLFGEQLPNFHGIVAQNFYFDHYLAQRDAGNLVQYVQSGGRMFLQAGPLSFLSQDPSIQSLFPCANQPRYQTPDTPLRWRPASGSGIQLPPELAQSLPHIQSQAGFVDCDVKPNTFVLAEREDGQPVLFAQNLGKGLVVTSLASDWHTQGVSLAQVDAGSIKGERSAALMEINLQTAATERLGTWVIEFLQRRQDSGLRAPDLAGPRLTTEDRFLLTRSRGGFRNDGEVILRGPNNQEILARPVQLSFLDREGLVLPQSLGSVLDNPSDHPFQPVHLVVRAEGQSEDDEEALLRGGHWPITHAPAKPLPQNHKLLAGLHALQDRPPESSDPDAAPRAQGDVQERPLIEVYPWLMALALALLCLDTFVTILWTQRKKATSRAP